EMGGLNHVPYMKAFHEKNVRVTINTRVSAVRRDGNALVAVLSSDFAKGWHDERRVDQLVVEHGTAPLDDLYFALKPQSRNLGSVDYEALIEGRDPFRARQPDAAFTLFRIGDAIASRNIHAAIYDGLRYTLTI
ncbi:N-methylproline demethylase, partial [Rhizobiaceae sp. 2RAB30]